MILKIIKTSRPLLWCIHIYTFIYGAVASQHFTLSSFHLWWGIFLLTLPFSLFVYAINDYYDIGTDSINDRKGGTYGEKHQGTFITYLPRLGLIGFLVSGVGFCFFGGTVLGIYLFLAVILYYYSAPPLRFKNIPILDAITGGTIYVAGVYLLGYLIAGGNIVMFTASLPTTFLYSLIVGTVFHLFGSLADEVPDRKEGIKTSSVYFGGKTICTFSLVCLFLVLWIVWDRIVFSTLTVVAIGMCLLLYKKEWRGTFLIKHLLAYGIYAVFFLTCILAYSNPQLLQ
jgi:4-hydroxybenzoate polyprenyltransferase